jgi:hypothetical protein
VSIVDLTDGTANVVDPSVHAFVASGVTLPVDPEPDGAISAAEGQALRDLRRLVKRRAKLRREIEECEAAITAALLVVEKGAP